MHPWHTRSRSFLRHVSTLLGLACLATTPLTAQEFAINQLTTGDQLAPDVATLPGGFVVVWQSPVTPGDDVDNLAAIGRFFDSLGSPTSGDFQVNTYTTYSQRRPRVATRQDGSFVVSWLDAYPGGKGLLNNLRARTFDSVGTGSAGDFQIAVSPNIYTTFNTHDVGAASAGEFVVGFSRFYNFDGNYDGQARIRRFQSDGTPIDSTTLVDQNDRDVTLRLTGNDGDGFVVTTASREYFGTYSDVLATRLGTSGVTSGGAIAVHGDQPNGFGGATGADVALAPSGEFIVAWNGYDTYLGTGNDVYGRQIGSDDTLEPAGPQKLNSYTTGFEFSPRVARGADGSFLVVWETTQAPSEDALGIRGRWLDSLGAPVSEAFAVNVYTTGNQRGPEVAPSADGQQFLVVWYSDGDGDGSGIRGRRLGLPGFVFTDGFESGDVSQWSNSAP